MTSFLGLTVANNSFRLSWRPPIDCHYNRSWFSRLAAFTAKQVKPPGFFILSGLIYGHWDSEQLTWRAIWSFRNFSWDCCKSSSEFTEEWNVDKISGFKTFGLTVPPGCWSGWQQIEYPQWFYNRQWMCLSARFPPSRSPNKLIRCYLLPVKYEDRFT